jgi:hypothetical protein
MTGLSKPVVGAFLGFGAALFGLSAAGAESSPEVWLSPGFYSRHFVRNHNFREDNTGLGAEFVFAPDHAAMAGTFINSDRARSRYLAYEWRPLHWRLADVDVSAGVAAGVVDGYPRMRNGGPFPAAMPVLAIEGAWFGANFTVIPAIGDRLHGAFVIQVKLRVW